MWMRSITKSAGTVGGVALLLTILMSSVTVFGRVAAQETDRPATIILDQTIPAEITFSPGSEDELTVTLPISLELHLQITLTSESSVAISMTGAEAAVRIVQPAPAISAASDAVVADKTTTVAQPEENAPIRQVIDNVEIEIVALNFFEYGRDVQRQIEQISPGYAYLLEDEQPPVVGFFEIAIKNNGDSLRYLRPVSEGFIIVGSEQVDLNNYWYISEEFGDEIYPGVIRQGAIVFGLKQTTLSDLLAGMPIRYITNGPSDHPNQLGEDEYSFEIYLVNGAVAAVPTATPTPMPTAPSTNTPTPTAPPTLTPIPSETPTPTVSPTPTSTPSPTLTLTPTPSEEEYKAQATSPDVTDLKRNTESYIGQVVSYTGTVRQVVEQKLEDGIGVFYFMLLDVDSDFSNTIVAGYTDFDGTGLRPLDGDVITIWGTVDSRVEYAALLGQQVILPGVAVKYIELQE